MCQVVKLYALSTCPWCKKIKRYLAEKEVPYEGVDIDNLEPREYESAIEEIQRLTGGTSVPVTVIKGRVIVGYRPEEISEVLENES